jgi:micrococcal nuclease
MNRLLHRIAVLFLLMLVIPSPCMAWSGKVVHVADGDTIFVLKSGKEIIVRLYGIDTPEKNQWYGQAAKAFTKSQVMGKTVDVQEIDYDHRWGRVVGVVTVGNLVLNKHLVEYGYACRN